MSGAAHPQYEVLGMDGGMPVPCGRSLPVVRRRSDGAFARYSSAAPSLSWHRADELDELLNQGRLTLFKSPPSFPAAAVAASPRPPYLVVFATATMLSTTRLALPESLGDTSITWTPLADTDRGWAACLPGDRAVALLDDWAEQVIGRLDQRLQRAGASPDAAGVELAHLGLCAAVSPSARWRLYLRYGLFMAPDRVRRTFDSFIGRELPHCSWQEYREAMASLRDVHRAHSAPRARDAHRQRSVRRPTNPDSKIADLAAVRPSEVLAAA